MSTSPTRDRRISDSEKSEVQIGENLYIYKNRPGEPFCLLLSVRASYKQVLCIDEHPRLVFLFYLFFETVQSCSHTFVLVINTILQCVRNLVMIKDTSPACTDLELAYVLTQLFFLGLDCT
jgi:hypothetical protein